MKRSLFLSGLLAFTILGASVAPAMAATEARLDRMAERLNLTSAQKDQVKEIFASGRMEITRVLTAQQTEQLQTARQQGTKGRQVFRSLNLSEAQKQRIKNIRQNTRQQISRILTPEQRKTMEQNRRR